MSNSIKNLLLLLLAVSFSTGHSQNKAKIMPLNSTENLKLINVKASVVSYNGQVGLRVEKEDGADDNNYSGTMVLIENSDFMDGVIELEISGAPAPDADESARGFVGVAFRIDTTDTGNYECIYIRPVNGRAENQLQRNHSVQYISHPEYTWQRLRKEQPGVYEAYADLVPGEWTKYKIVISGESARLYLHGGEQPTLIVNDLKHGVRNGLIGLWLNISTIAHYRNLKIYELEK